MPWFAANLGAFFDHKVGYDDALSCREVDDGKGCRVFDRVVERPPAVIKRCPILRKALSEPNEIGKASVDE